MTKPHDSLEVGDTVAVRGVARTRAVGEAEGWWSDGMRAYCGREGVVEELWGVRVRVRFTNTTQESTTAAADTAPSPTCCWWYSLRALCPDTPDAPPCTTPASSVATAEAIEVLEWLQDGSSSVHEGCEEGDGEEEEEWLRLHDVTASTASSPSSRSSSSTDQLDALILQVEAAELREMREKRENSERRGLVDAPGLMSGFARVNV